MARQSTTERFITVRPWFTMDHRAVKVVADCSVVAWFALSPIIRDQSAE